MKILVTGAEGFVGRNLCAALARRPDVETLRCDVGTPPEDLDAAVRACGFVFHLAGVNRPKDAADFKTGNADFTASLLARLEAAGRAAPVVLSSSIQAALDNPYGESKRAAEEAVFAYARRTGAAAHVFRLANVFGKWSRPNYNSAVATWCHNLARGLPIEVRDPAAAIRLVYIDDVVAAFLARLGAPGAAEILSVEPCYEKTLGEVADLLRAFRDEPTTLAVPDQGDGFAKKLYATYLSFLPEDGFAYPLTAHRDARGSFTEVLRTADRGQVSVNVSRPGVVKGQHWHDTKHEKFLVVSGTGVIRFRRADAPGAPVLEYRVCGETPDVVRVPPGYTHNIENTGGTDLVTLMWANEPFDPARPDTYREEV